VETKPGHYEICDGWHRSSIARHLGITHLKAGVYTLELQERWRAANPEVPKAWHVAPASSRERIEREGIDAGELVIMDLGYATTWARADGEATGEPQDLWQLDRPEGLAPYERWAIANEQDNPMLRQLTHPVRPDDLHLGQASLEGHAL
jgi:hypothetical protein